MALRHQSLLLFSNDHRPTGDVHYQPFLAAVMSTSRIKMNANLPDRGTADDLLGVVEIPLKDVMTDLVTKDRMSARKDPLYDYEGKLCPGSLYWDVGYFSKLSVDEHLSKLSHIDVGEMKRKIETDAENKLREAKGTDEPGEIDQ